MHEEIMMIMDDWYKSMTLPKTQYMPDSTLYAILQEKKMGLPSTYQLREAVLESMEEASFVDEQRFWRGVPCAGEGIDSRLEWS